MARSRSLAALVAAELVSTTGTTLTFVALPWFVLVTTGSATRMSIVLAAELVPVAVFGIPSGSVVARLGARRTMLVADLVRAPLIALVPVLHWAGHLSFPVLIAIVVALGLFSAPYFASQRTIVPELFADDEKTVAKASALFGGVTQLALVLGPALGGALVAWLGAPAVLLVDGATYLFAFACVLVLVRGGGRVVQTDDTRGVLAGVRYLVRDRLLGPLTLTVIVLDMAGGAIAVVIPLAAFVRYGRDPHVGGWLFTLFGVGALLGSVIAMKALDRVAPLRLASGAILLAVVPLWLLGISMPWPLAGLALLACGFCVPFVNAPAMGLITTRPPEALRAKVMTAVMTASGLGAPVGRIAVGPIYVAWGLGAAFVAIAAAMTVGAVLFVAAAARGEGAPAGDYARATSA